jgi:cyclopropane fatty-acyl-phospholipid synthase-like methyltransferase
MELKELSSIWAGFTASRVLLTANSYRLFDHLEKQKTAEEVARSLKLDRRAATILLDALTGLGVLKKSRGRYRNTPVASRHLVAGKPGYQGDIVRHYEVLWDNWSALNEVMLTGVPASRSFDHHSFITGMHNLARARVEEFVRALDLKGVKTALDLGGGPGTYAMALAKKGVDVILYDRPETMRIARNMAKTSGVKLTYRKGDFIHDPIGKGFDLVLVSHILHAYSPEESAALLKKCAEALNPGGTVAIQEVPINDDMASPPRGALFAVNMLVNTPEGRCYPPSEIQEMLKEAGFAGVRGRTLNETTLVTGRVPKR